MPFGLCYSGVLPLETTTVIKRLLFTFLILSFCLTLLARDKKIIRIGFPEDFPPFYSLNAENEYEGISFEVVSRALRNLDYKIEVKQFDNMSTLFSEVKKGSVDAIVNLTATKDRKQFLDFTTNPHVYESQDLISLKTSPFTYTGSLLSLSRYKVGVIHGWTHGKDFDSADFLQKVYVLDSKKQLQGLLSGRFDLIVNNRHYFNELAQKSGVALIFSHHAPSLEDLPVTVGISKLYPESEKLVEKLNVEISEFKLTEEYRLLLKGSGLSR